MSAGWTTLLLCLLLPASSSAALQGVAPAPDTVAAPSWWTPATWGAGGSVLWREKDGEKDVELDLDLFSTWRDTHNEVQVRLRSAYEIADGEGDKNEQVGRLRWFRDLGVRWFVMAGGDLERNSVDLGLATGPLDYRLVRGTLGAGARKRWGARGATRVAVQWNEFHLRLLDYRQGEGLDAPSLFVDSHLALGEKVTLTHWGNVLFWDDGTKGWESEAEIAFAITGNFSLGFRHLYRDQAATLQTSHENEVKVFTRVAF